MVRKHLAVASALVLLMAVTAQAAVRVRIDNARDFSNFGSVLKGYTSVKDLSLTVTGGTASVTVGPSNSTSGLNTLSTGTASGTSTISLPVNISLNDYAERLTGKLVIPNGVGGTLSLSYRADVGIANRITRRPKTVTDFTRAMALTAPVASGATISGLSSKVRERGSLAASTIEQTAVVPVKYKQNPRSLKWMVDRPRTNLRQLYGVVGSEAEIVASTALPAATDVSMTWRARTKGEAHATKSTTSPTVGLPVNDPSLSETNGKWLTSDVVKVGFTAAGGTATVAAPAVYAMQMTFDNRINMALEPAGTDASVTAEHDALRLAQLNTTTNKWTDPTGNPLQSEPETHLSLAAFLASKIGTAGGSTGTVTLADLVGSWGVDDNPVSPSHPFGVSTTGKGYSWAIVAGGGSGIFAVVPEPGTLALLISGGLGLVVFGVRRMRKTVA